MVMTTGSELLVSWLVIRITQSSPVTAGGQLHNATA